MITYSAEETIQWGREFAKRLKAPVLVLMTGDLGTGKTTLTKGLVSGLGAANENDVTSPTFTLVHVYGKQAKVYHADLYRIDSFHDFETLGPRETLSGPGTAVRLGRAPWPKHMPSEHAILRSSETQGIELKSYNVSIPMGTLAIGVDNIHHDVFLSPRFVQAARDYLLDLIRQHTSSAHSLGMEPTRGPDSVAFRKLLSELLQSALTQAKYHKNIEIDLLFRLSLLKFLTFEIANQFANLILEGKEWVRQRGEHFERSQQAHVIKAKLSELQTARRRVLRTVGQQVAQMVVDVEENVVCKARRALFGEEFAELYDLLKNRIIFLDGGK